MAQCGSRVLKLSLSYSAQHTDKLARKVLKMTWKGQVKSRSPKIRGGEMVRQALGFWVSKTGRRLVANRKN